MARMRASDRRRQLLEVAAEQFARRGYHGTTTAALAEAAGVTEPVLYRHFKNKLDLFVRLIEELGTEVIEAWRSMLEPIDSPTERLRALLAGNPATHARSQGVYRVIFQAMTDTEVDATVATAIGAHIGELHAFLATQVRGLQKAGVVRRDEPAAALAWLLVSVAIGYGMLHPLGVVRPGRTAGKTSMQRLVAEVLTAT